MLEAPITYDKWGQCGKYFEWKNHNVFFQRGGNGQSLLLLHGFPTCSWDWSWLSPHLIKRFYMVQPDLLDYGRSLNASGTPCSIMDQADMIEALMKQRGIKATHILAHDVGDSVAQELIARHNESTLSFRILSCVLLNGGVIPSLHKARAVQHLLAGPFGKWVPRLITKDRFLKAFADVFSKHTRPKGPVLNAFWPAILGANGKASLPRRIQYMAERKKQANRWTAALKNAHLPLMYVCGMADPVSGAHMADGFEMLVPKARLVRLPGIGHYPQCEAPETVAEIMHQFHDCIVEKQNRQKVAQPTY
ncbi:alpha/beta fold hydrolase [Kordiimonas pumila]|uniref:Alpha/beta fold hydrolase n=1 Tax=Kordiimonas pumila TaxID=2161677 RepID=A0ABV7D5U7_9PROT|nr:alpha/beta hydrolase [Kordiimonas pumila]